MSYLQFFFTLFCQVFVALGLNLIMDEGQLLYFLRRPFEGLYDEFTNKRAVLSCMGDEGKQEALRHILKLKIKYYLAKPFVLCITCFASVWGGSVFVALNGLTLSLLPYLIISCISAAFIQTYIYAKANL